MTAISTGIAGKINPNSGGNNPTMTAVTGVYTAMWNEYLNDQAFANWDFHHTDPTGAQKGLDAQGNVILYTGPVTWPR